MVQTYSEILPVTGVGVMILKEREVLLGKRKGAHGEGEYAFPGGKVDHGETFDQCAARETREECGVEITNIRFQFVANMRSYLPRHFTHIALLADWESGEPQVREPEKCEHWGWYDPAAPPEPLFSVADLTLRHYRGEVSGCYFDLA